jgi:hypothetical protein
MVNAEAIIEKWANNLTKQIRDNLVSKDAKFDRSTLAQSIVAMPIEVTEDGFRVFIVMNDYGEFVDKGRGASHSSEGGKVRSGLAGASGWIARYDGKGGFNLKMTRVVNVKKANGSIVQRTVKYKNKIAANKAASFAIASKIHKYGYKSKGYGFWSEVVNDNILEGLSSDLLKVTGDNYMIELTEED